MRKYRIVTDKYLGFEVQERIWYSFSWVQSSGSDSNFSNTHGTLEKAKEHIKYLKEKRKPSKEKIVYTG